LAEVLQGLALQTLPPSDFELILVVNGANKRVEDLLQAASLPYALRWFVRPRDSEAAARNLALEQARGDVVVSLDDNMVPAPEFLQRHLAWHGPDTRNVAIGGVVDHPASPELFLARTIGWTRGFCERLSLPGYAPTHLDLPGGNFSVLRQHLLAAGGWDRELDSGDGFDIDLGLRLLQHGLALRAEPAALTYRRSSHPLGAALLRARSLGRARIAYLEKHPERIDDLFLPRFLAGSWEMRALLRLAGLIPGWCFVAFARAIAPLLLTARWRVNRLTAALVRRLWAFYVCRGFWDLRKSFRQASRIIRSRNRTREWFRCYWQGRTWPEHLEDSESYRAAYGREVAGLAGDKARGWVLELGCGDGTLFQYLGFSPERYRGVDFSASMLGLFAARHPGLDLILAEGSTYVGMDRKYDLILSTGVVQYFDEAMLTTHLQNARRMLAPGGRLVLATVPDRRHRLKYLCGFDRGSGWNPLASGRNMLERTLRRRSLGHWYSRRQLSRLAGEHGFAIEFAPSGAFPCFLHAVLQPAASPAQELQPQAVASQTRS